MTKKYFILLLLVSISSFAQITGILTDPSAACDPFNAAGVSACGLTDWQHVGVSLDSGIATGDGLPDNNYTQCTGWTQTYPSAGTGTGKFTTSNCPAAGADCSPAINTAYASCAANTYLQLDSGVYPNATSVMVNKKSVALWGTVADLGSGSAIQTIFNDMAGQNGSSLAGNDLVKVGCFSGCSPSSTSVDTVTPASAAAGSTTLQITSNTNMTAALINAGAQYAVITELNLHPFASYTGSEGSSSGATWASYWGPNAGRMRTRGEIVKITGCNGQSAPNVTSCPNGTPGTPTAVTIERGLSTSYSHTLPSRATSTYYGWGATIQAGGHYYGNCLLQTSFTSDTTNNFSTPGTYTLKVNNSSLWNYNSGTTGTPVPNPTCGFYAGEKIHVTDQGTGNPNTYEEVVLTAVTPNTSCNYGGGANCPYGGTITATFVYAHPLIASKGIMNIAPYLTTSGSGAAPTFPTDGSAVTDDATLQNSAVWMDLGTCPNSPCDTYPQISTYKMVDSSGTNAMTGAGVKYIRAKTVQNLVNNVYPRTGGNGTFEMASCSGCWIAGVQSDYSYVDHVYVGLSYRWEVRDLYANNNWYHTAGGHDGVISLNYSSRGLLENFICERLHGCVVPGRGIAANVLSYGYSSGGFSSRTGATWGGYDWHSPTPSMNLVEGNAMTYHYADSIWGSDTFAVTSMRNWWRGADTLCYPNFLVTSEVKASCGTLYGISGTTYGASNVAPYVSAANPGVSMYTYQTGFGIGFAYSIYSSNIVGDVVGSDQQNSSKGATGTSLTPLAAAAVLVANSASGSTNCSSFAGCRTPYEALWGELYGFSEAVDTGTWVADSSAPFVTAMRHGLYNYIGNSTTWYGAVTHTLPASFYRTSKPNFFSRMSCWPCIAGDTTFVGGAVNNHLASPTGANPAQYYYLNLMGGAEGGSGPLDTFDPTWFYQTPPVAPYTVYASCTGTGSGTIAGNDASHCLAGGCSNMNCTCTAGTPSGTCSVNKHSTGDAPTYTATASTGNFLGWSGGCSGTGNCLPDVTTNPTITAQFDPVPVVTIACSPCTLNIGGLPTLSVTTTNVAGASDARWVIQAFDAFNPDGYLVSFCNSTNDPTDHCMASASGPPVLGGTPIIATTYIVTATANQVSQSASTSVNVQAPLSYGYYNH